MDDILCLRELTKNDETAFLVGLKDWDEHDLSWYTFIWKKGMSFQEHLEILKNNSLGLNLEKRWVPSTMLYGFIGQVIVGRVHIRHFLNEELTHRKRWGHIGYSVSPRFRQKGYATEMVRQAIPFCRKIGIKDLLITCADNNEASWKIIEKYNGTLEDRVWDDVDKEIIRRYWIKL
jgi:predicted acetyltransferase